MIRLVNDAPGMSVFTVVLGTLFMGFIGIAAGAFFLIEFWRQPSLGLFLGIHFMGIWPLWTASVMAYGLLFWRKGGRVVFPAKTPRAFLVVNLVVILPIAVLLEFVLRAMVKDVHTIEWTWRAAVALLLVGVPVILVVYGFRLAFRAHVDELASHIAPWFIKMRKDTKDRE